MTEGTEASRRSRRYIEIGLVIGLFVTPFVFRALGSIVFPPSGGSNQASAEWARLGGCIQLIMLILLFWHISRLNDEPLSTFTQPFRMKDIAIGAQLAVAAIIVSYLVKGFIYEVLQVPYSATEKNSNVEAVEKNLSVLIVAYMLIAGVTEELVVRGFLQTRFKQLAWPALVSILASVLLQVSYHIYQGVVACVSLGFQFLIFAVYYDRTKRLWPVLVAHLCLSAWAIYYYASR